jgi:hypothetical protein
VSFIPRSPGYIGTESEPLKIRLQNFGMTGPGTGAAVGVKARGSGEALFFKGDPAPELAYHPSRFIDLIKLPDEYGTSGVASVATSGCPAGDASGANDSNFLRFENSLGDTTEGYRITFFGDFRSPAQGGTFRRGQLINFAWDDQPSLKNTVRAASGTEILDTLTLPDTNRITGPGIFGSVIIKDCTEASPCNGNAALSGRNNVIDDTNVSGTVAINADTENTTISNVNFTGSARAVITVGANSTATVDDLCVPNGSSITIASGGSVLYEGETKTSDYTFPNGTVNCNITVNDRPDPPGVN